MSQELTFHFQESTKPGQQQTCPFRITLVRRMDKDGILNALSRDKKRKKDSMKYLLLFCATQEELAAWQALPEEARAQTRAKSGQWMVEHRSQIRSDNGLHLPHTVTSVHVGAGGHPLVTDG